MVDDQDFCPGFVDSDAVASNGTDPPVSSLTVPVTAVVSAMAIPPSTRSPLVRLTASSSDVATALASCGEPSQPRAGPLAAPTPSTNWLSGGVGATCP